MRTRVRSANFPKHFKHRIYATFALPIGSRLLTTAVGLVTLYLHIVHPSTYFHPNILLRWLSFMPQLETLSVNFSFPVPNRDVERQLTHAPITTHITLPNLHVFEFRGIGTYLEPLVHRVNAPRLESLWNLGFQPTYFFCHASSLAVCERNREPHVQERQILVLRQGH
jgi:hypothetical protein